MPKVYAVRNGRQRGIYHSWDEAKAQVNGYSGAQFKGFSNVEGALEYMGTKNSSTAYSNGGSRRYSSSTYSNVHNSTIPKPRSAKSSGVKQKQEIYVDGSSLNNGKNGAKAGWGVYFGEGDTRNSSGSVEGEQTNNRAELTALKLALRHVDDRSKSYIIHTDSQYTMNAIDTWSDLWEKNNWKLSSTGKEVKNQDLIKDIRTTLNDLRSKGYDVELSKVKGHSNIHGNEQADLLARKGADRS